MKSLRPDQVAYSMNKQQFSKSLFKNLHWLSGNFFENPFYVKDSLASYLCWAMLVLNSHSCTIVSLLQFAVKILVLKILCKFCIFCIGLSFFSWFHNFIIILLLFVTVQQCCRALHCLLSSEQNDGGFVGRLGAWKTWVRLTLLPEAQRCLCLFEVRNFTWAAAA